MAIGTKGFRTTAVCNREVLLLLVVVLLQKIRGISQRTISSIIFIERLNFWTSSVRWSSRCFIEILRFIAKIHCTFFRIRVLVTTSYMFIFTFGRLMIQKRESTFKYNHLRMEIDNHVTLFAFWM